MRPIAQLLPVSFSLASRLANTLKCHLTDTRQRALIKIRSRYGFGRNGGTEERSRTCGFKRTRLWWYSGDTHHVFVKHDERPALGLAAELYGPHQPIKIIDHFLCVPGKSRELPQPVGSTGVFLRSSLPLLIYLDVILRSRIDYWPVLEESSMMAITRRLYQARRSTEYVEDFLSYTLGLYPRWLASERDKAKGETRVGRNATRDGRKAALSRIAKFHSF